MSSLMKTSLTLQNINNWLLVPLAFRKPPRLKRRQRCCRMLDKEDLCFTEVSASVDTNSLS